MELTVLARCFAATMPRNSHTQKSDKPKRRRRKEPERAPAQAHADEKEEFAIPVRRVDLMHVASAIAHAVGARLRAGNAKHRPG